MIFGKAGVWGLWLMCRLRHFDKLSDRMFRTSTPASEPLILVTEPVEVTF